MGKTLVWQSLLNNRKELVPGIICVRTLHYVYPNYPIVCKLYQVIITQRCMGNGPRDCGDNLLSAVVAQVAAKTL